MTIHLTLETKPYLLYTEKREDINIYHISQLPSRPPLGKCLIQDFWHTAGPAYTKEDVE